MRLSILIRQRKINRRDHILSGIRFAAFFCSSTLFCCRTLCC